MFATVFKDVNNCPVEEVKQDKDILFPALSGEIDLINTQNFGKPVSFHLAVAVKQGHENCTTSLIRIQAA